MSKRGAERQLTKDDDPDDEGEQEPTGERPKADPEVREAALIMGIAFSLMSMEGQMR